MTDAPHHTILEVDNLCVDFFTRAGTVHAVRNVSFDLVANETLGIVGESGSGKSVTAQAILGLTELPGRVTSGQVRWKGEPIVSGPNAERNIYRVRGKEISMVFQDPMTSLNPVFTVGMQITEVIRRHLGFNKKQAIERAIELLDLVGIANPRDRIKQYPFEMSGGMRQRVLIAAALACEPALLIADEPTTALDVTIQAQVLDLIASLQKRLGIAVILITHDLGVVAGVCDRVAVMYAGRFIETADAFELYATPAHPYSAGLLRSTPRIDVEVSRLDSIPGAPPDLKIFEQGCAFVPRCTRATDKCAHHRPTLDITEGTRRVACWNPIHT